MKYLGYVQRNDPLYGFLHDEIQPKLNLSGDLDYRVFLLHASNSVFLYEETRSLRRIIGKFYYCGGENRAAAHATLEQEFANLKYIRSLGFCGNGMHYIARPLGRNAALNELLLEEYCYGESLSSVIRRSIQNSDPELLFYKLTALAFFLSRLHNRTTQPGNVDFNPAVHYAHGIIRTLAERGWISEHRKNRFHELVHFWHDRPEMWSDCPVTVHGDATPENFLFGDGLHVISFDLERMRSADRLFDVGRLTAELAHFFMLYAGNRFYAEPFIGHFLWEYSCHFPDRGSAFRAISRRLPYYMGINLMRIARNNYFTWDYRQMLLNAASECLKGGLK